MNFRKIIFWGHWVAGVVTGLVILNSAVTGALLAFEPQIVALSEAKVRKINLPEAPARLAPSLILEKAVFFKKGSEPSGITIKRDPASSILVSFGKEGGSLFMHPYTGEVLGKPSVTHDLFHKMEDWHRWLWSKEIGKKITGTASLIFFGMAITGLFLWWPKKWDTETRANIFLFNKNQKGKARDWNWHNVIGFWCAPIILMTSLTGVIMSYSWANDLLYRLSGNEPPPVISRETSRDKKVKEVSPKKLNLDVDRLWGTAQNKIDEWVSISLRFPRNEKDAVTALIEEKAPFWVPAPRSTLTLHPKTAEEIKWESFRERNLGKTLRAYARYLHTGETGSFAGQFLAFLSAIGSAVLVWTGFSLALRRYLNWRAKKRGQDK